MSKGTITVTLKKGLIGKTDSVKGTVAGLGLRKIGSTRKLENTPAVRGMIKKIIHMVEVKES